MAQRRLPVDDIGTHAIALRALLELIASAQLQPTEVHILRDKGTLTAAVEVVEFGVCADMRRLVTQPQRRFTHAPDGFKAQTRRLHQAVVAQEYRLALGSERQTPRTRAPGPAQAQLQGALVEFVIGFVVAPEGRGQHIEFLLPRQRVHALPNHVDIGGFRILSGDFHCFGHPVPVVVKTGAEHRIGGGRARIRTLTEAGERRTGEVAQAGRIASSGGTQVLRGAVALPQPGRDQAEVVFGDGTHARLRSQAEENLARGNIIARAVQGEPEIELHGTVIGLFRCRLPEIPQSSRKITLSVGLNASLHGRAGQRRGGAAREHQAQQHTAHGSARLSGNGAGHDGRQG